MNTMTRLAQIFTNLLDYHDKKARSIFFFSMHKADIKRCANELRKVLANPAIQTKEELLWEMYCSTERERGLSGSNPLIQDVIYAIADELGMDQQGRYNKSLDSLVYAGAPPAIIPLPFHKKVEQRLMPLCQMINSAGYQFTTA